MGAWIEGRPGRLPLPPRERSGSASATPGLNDIEASSEPGWLWDPERHRVLWANEAAIAFLGGDTLFDVVDRLFDPSEPAVAALVRPELSNLNRVAETVCRFARPCTSASTPATKAPNCQLKPAWPPPMKLVRRVVSAKG